MFIGSYTYGLNHDVAQSDIQLEEQARIAAKQRHCKDTNAAALLGIYDKIVSC
jgi:hypothetical protein